MSSWQKLNLAGILLLAFSLQSCLQWRYSDRDLTKIFRQNRLPLAIHHIRAAGSNLRYVEVRASEDSIAKPNVLLIHGAPSSLRVWVDYLTEPALIRRCNLYAVDRPGYGHSDFGSADTSILHQVQVLEEVLKRHSGPWVVFGSSFGGPIAAVLAARNPDRVRSVLLTSPALAPGQEKIYGISYYIRRPALGWFFPTIFRVANAEKLSHASQLRSVESYYAQVTQPVTYLYGGQDVLVYPSNAEYARKTFTATQIRLLRLEDRPHFFTFSEKARITQELIALADTAQPGWATKEEIKNEK